MNSRNAIDQIAKKEESQKFNAKRQAKKERKSMNLILKNTEKFKTFAFMFLSIISKKLFTYDFFKKHLLKYRPFSDILGKFLISLTFSIATLTMNALMIFLLMLNEFQ